MLQPTATEGLRSDLRDKTRVIYQSVEDIPGGKPLRTTKTRKQVFSGSFTKQNFDVCVVGHLRTVKDPFRAALASRLLPKSSRIHILQIGAPLTAAMAARAEAEARTNPRYCWLGEQPRSRVRRILARSDVCVLSSRIEGGANVLSEAIVASVPILASRIDGNIGILGPDYPGFFSAGDTHQLARLLTRAETDSGFLGELKSRVKGLAPLFDPKCEQRAWADLIRDFHIRQTLKCVSEVLDKARLPFR